MSGAICLLPLHDMQGTLHFPVLHNQGLCKLQETTDVEELGKILYKFHLFVIVNLTVSRFLNFEVSFIHHVLFAVWLALLIAILWFLTLVEIIPDVVTARTPV